MYYVYLFHRHFQNIKYIKEENNLICNRIIENNNKHDISDDKL